jgi:hypothetical protein
MDSVEGNDRPKDRPSHPARNLDPLLPPIPSEVTRKPPVDRVAPESAAEDRPDPMPTMDFLREEYANLDDVSDAVLSMADHPLVEGAGRLVSATSPDSALAPDAELDRAADDLTSLLTNNTGLRFALQRLQSAVAEYDLDRSNDEARSQRDATLRRYVGILQESLADHHTRLAEGVNRAADIVESPDATPQAMDFIGKSLLLIGVAILASMSAGAIGALIVKEMVWKEVVKSAVAAFITTTATLVAERAWRKPATGEQ